MFKYLEKKILPVKNDTKNDVNIFLAKSKVTSKTVFSYRRSSHTQNTNHLEIFFRTRTRRFKMIIQYRLKASASNTFAVMNF